MRSRLSTYRTLIPNWLPFPQEGAHLVAQVPDDDRHVADAERIAQDDEVAHEEWLTVHLEEHLGDGLSFRVSAQPASGGGNQSLGEADHGGTTQLS